MVLLIFERAGLFLFCYLGLFAGVLVAGFAEEELRPGKNYFFAMQIILLAMLAVLMFFINTLAGAVSLLLSAIFIWKHGNADYYQGIFFYLSSAVFASLSTGILLIPITTIVFLFGFPSGTILAYANKDAVPKPDAKKHSKKQRFAAKKASAKHQACFKPAKKQQSVFDRCAFCRRMLYTFIHTSSYLAGFVFFLFFEIFVL